LGGVAALGAVIALPVAATSFDPQTQPIAFILAAVAGMGVLPGLLLLHLYLGGGMCASDWPVE
jgi:Protein of unknown function (DUF1230).